MRMLEEGLELFLLYVVVLVAFFMPLFKTFLAGSVFLLFGFGVGQYGGAGVNPIAFCCNIGNCFLAEMRCVGI